MPVSHRWQPCTKVYPKLMRADIEPLLSSMDNWVVFDTETSGLPSGRKKTANPEIVEMSVVAVASGEILFDSLFCPKDLEAYLQSEARGMHAWPEESYQDAPRFWEKWSDILDIIAHYHMCAFNSDFDVPMLVRTAHMWGLSVPRLRATCAMELFSTFQTTESHPWDSYKLSEACSIMGITQEDYGTPHSSLCDALATRQLLLKMRDMIGE